MPQVPNERVSSIPEILAASSEYNCLMDPKDFQAFKVYLLGLILKAISGLETDNFCDLMDTVKPYDYLSEYQRQAVYVYLLGQIAEGLGIDDSDVSQATIREQLSCACSTSKQSMELAEMVLLYSILGELQAP